MPSLFDFLKRLFSRRRPTARKTAMSFGGPEPTATSVQEPGPEPFAESDSTPERKRPPPKPLVAVGADEEADEEEEPDEVPAEEEFDDGDDPHAPDPFVSPDAPPIAALSIDAVARRRAEAMAVALTGEHRVFLADSPGPGTLAEALNLLAQQGKVVAEFRDDADDGPYLLYRVVVADAEHPTTDAL
jgi:hypothetical protein